MLFVVKTLLCLCLSALPALADACCQKCAQGCPCASEKIESQHPTPPEALTPISPGALAERYPQLLVFVSFSMPMEALKALGAQVNQLGGALVFRGLVDSSFKKTAEKFKEFKQPALIDPTLFEAYKVTAVPTFVLRKVASDQAEEPVIHDRMQGHVSLIHALEQFEKQGEAAAAVRTLLYKIRKSP